MVRTRISGILIKITFEEVHLFFKKIIGSNEYEYSVKATTFLSFENESFSISIDYSDFDRDIDGYYTITFHVKHNGSIHEATHFIKKLIFLLNDLKLTYNVDYQEEDIYGSPIGKEFYILSKNR